MLNKLADTILKKIEMTNMKYQQQQNALHRNEQLKIEAQLKAFLKPHIEAPLGECPYFHSQIKISLPCCTYDAANGLWRIASECVVETSLDLESPRVVVSLNQSKDIYFARLRQEMENELLELGMMSEMGNANPAELQVANLQLQRKYEILRHELKFHSIECQKEGSKSIVKIWAGFR